MLGSTPSIPDPRAVVFSKRGEVTSVDIGPPGLTSEQKAALGFAIMFALLVLPLGGTGVGLALTASDWPLALRVPVGLVGAGACLANVAAILWFLWVPRRSFTRIQWGPGLFVVRRLALFRSRIVFGGSVQVTPVKAADQGSLMRLFGPGPLRLTDGQQTVFVGAGLSFDDRQRLQRALEGATDRVAEAGFGAAIEWDYPMGQGGAQALSEWGAALLAPLRRPVSFIILDVAVLIGLLGLGRLLWAPSLAVSYPIAFVAFVVGLALRRSDHSYLRGLRGYLASGVSFYLLYGSAGLVVGLAGTLGLHRVLGWIPALIVAPSVLLGLHIYLMRLSEREPEGWPAHRPRIELLSTALMVPLMLLHEELTYASLGGSSRLFLPLPLIATVVAFVYAPVRLHAFVDNPNDRSNRLWAGLTVALITLYGISGWSPL